MIRLPQKYVIIFLIPGYIVLSLFYLSSTEHKFKSSEKPEVATGWQSNSMLQIRLERPLAFLENKENYLQVNLKQNTN